MSTITAILEPDADGTLHLPVPDELRGGMIEITATLKPAVASRSIPIGGAPATDDRYESGYTRIPEDIGLTHSILPHLAVDTEVWE